MAALKLISELIGWTYVLCWFLLNIKLRSSDGVSIDFLYLNTLGYLTYLTSLCLQVFNKKVRLQFHDKYGDYPLLSGIDVVYAAHGLVMNLIIASQLYIWGFKRNSAGRINTYTKYVILFVLLLVGFQLVAINRMVLQYVDLAVNLAYIKVGISFIKYIPQLHHNYIRHSCSGFSVAQIWLDFSGGSFAVIQLFLDNYIDNNSSFKWAEIGHNKGKLGLSLVTFFFDLCFFIQYYFIYHENIDEDVLRKKDDNLARDSSSEHLLSLRDEVPTV